MKSHTRQLIVSYKCWPEDAVTNRPSYRGKAQPTTAYTLLWRTGVTFSAAIIISRAHHGFPDRSYTYHRSGLGCCFERPGRYLGWHDWAGERQLRGEFAQQTRARASHGYPLITAVWALISLPGPVDTHTHTNKQMQWHFIETRERGSKQGYLDYDP